MRKYYGFEYYGSPSTTAGFPNPRTGRCNTAGHLAVFNTRQERDLWVSQGKVTSAMRGNCREAVTLKEVRYLFQGMPLIDFKEFLEYYTPINFPQGD